MLTVVPINTPMVPRLFPRIRETTRLMAASIRDLYRSYQKSGLPHTRYVKIHA